MPLRLLLVDDEAPARSRLRRLLGPLEDAGRVAIADEATDGVEALEKMEAAADEGAPIDLVLLDVQMPGLDGFGVVDKMPGVQDELPAVVFVTAFDEYALRAFEASAVDYLLKPVNADRLAQAVARVERLRGATGKAEQEQRLADLATLLDLLDDQAGGREQAGPREAPKPAPVARAGGEPALEPLRQLSLPHRDRIALVPVERLVSAEVDDGVTWLYIAPEHGDAPPTRHLVSTTLDALEARLDARDFMRVHRSALVRLAHVRELVQWFSGRYKLVLTGGHEVIASRNRSRELRDLLSL